MKKHLKQFVFLSILLSGVAFAATVSHVIQRTGTVNFTGTYTTPNITINPLGWYGNITGSSSTAPFNVFDFTASADTFQDTFSNSLINLVNITHNFGGGGGLGGYAGLDVTLLNTGGASGNVGGQYTAITTGGRLINSDNGAALTFTAGPLNGSTSATLNANWTNPTGSYTVLFSDGETRVVTLTNTATTATWSGGLLNTVTTAAGAYSGTIYAFNPNVGVQTSAQYIRGLVGAEYDIQDYAGNILFAQIGEQMVQTALSRNLATGENIAYSINGDSGAPGWQMAYALGSYDGFPGPMTSTGTVMGCWRHASTFQQVGLGGNCLSTGYGVDFAGLGNGGYPTVFSQAAFTSQGFEIDGSGHILNSTAGGNVFIGADTAAVYDGIVVIPSVTANNTVEITPAGSGANIDLHLQSKGTSNVYIQNGNNGFIGAFTGGGASGVSGDYVNIVGIAGGNNFASVAAAGSDANVDLRLISKGTRSVIAAPGTDGVAFKVQNAAFTNTYLSVNSSTNAIALGLAGTSVTMPGLASSSAATTGTLCWTTVTGNVNVDTTLACLSSTQRVKQNIHPLDAGLSEVMALRPVSYDLKPEFNPKGLGPMVGLVAEETQKIDSRLVGTDEEGQPLGVRYMQLTAVLVKAIQEQQHEIDELKRQLKKR